MSSGILSRGILSGAFCPVAFCPVAFCPGHFVRWHFVRGILTRGILSSGILSWTRVSRPVSNFSLTINRQMNIEPVRHSPLITGLFGEVVPDYGRGPDFWRHGACTTACTQIYSPQFSPITLGLQPRGATCENFEATDLNIFLYNSPYLNAASTNFFTGLIGMNETDGRTDRTDCSNS